MAKIFSVGIVSNASSGFIGLELPIPDYELLDAIDCLRLGPDEEMELELENCGTFNEFYTYFNDLHIYALNALAKKLASLDYWQKDAFKGLLQMAIDNRDPNINFQTLMHLADNTDCCQVLYTKNDTELGWFYANNGKLPELAGLPEAVYDLLDYDAIGKKIRQDEKGVFVGKAYVVKVSPMEQKKEYTAGRPSEPDYIISVKIDEKVLNLPCEDLDASHELRLPHVIEVIDSAVPYITGGSGNRVIGTHEQNVAWLRQANELSHKLVELRDAGLLMTIKAMVDAAQCISFNQAIELADRAHEYSLALSQNDFREAGENWIREKVVEPEAVELILQHTNLISLGKQVFADVDVDFTDYGMLKHDYPEQQMGGMELG